MAGFLYEDLSRSAIWTALTGTLGDGGVDRLADPQPRHRCRLTNAATETLLGDLGLAKSVDCFALVSTNLRAATQIRVRASSSDPNAVTGVVYDSGTLTGVTEEKWLGQVVLIAPAPVTARYVRWDFTDASLGPVDIGLAPLGLLFRPEVSFSYGAELHGRVDYGLREINARTGAAFGVSGPQARAIRASFDVLTEAEITTAFLDMERLVGASGDVLFVPNENETAANRARDAIWGSFRQPGYAASSAPYFQVLTRAFEFVERL